MRFPALNKPGSNLFSLGWAGNTTE